MANLKQKKNIVLDQSGITFVEALVAVAVIGIVIYSLLDSLLFLNRAQKTVEMTGNQNDLQSSIESILFDQGTCTNVMQAFQFPPDNGNLDLDSISFGEGYTVAAVGGVKNGLKIKSMSFLTDPDNMADMGFGSENGIEVHKYVSNFQFTSERSSQAFGQRQYVNNYPVVIYANKATKKIEKCFGGVDPFQFQNGGVFQEACNALAGVFNEIKFTCSFPSCGKGQYVSYHPIKGILECRDLTRLCVLQDVNGGQIGEGFEKAIDITTNTWTNCFVQSCVPPFKINSGQSGCSL